MPGRVTHSGFRLALVSVVLALGPAGVARADDFATVFKRNFMTWDADHDGKLTPVEVDALCVDPKWKGEDAAAIATLKMGMRAKQSPLGPISLDEVSNVVKRPMSDDGDVMPDDPAKRYDTLESRYRRSSRIIRSTNRDLFVDATPDLDRLHQGRIGDCFFVSIVGALVERDAGSIKRMIKPVDRDTYTVAFGESRDVTIKTLTDAELALSSTTGDEGLWLPVLEKAYGAMRMGLRPKSRQSLNVTDSIASGGSIATSIRVLTGHAVDTTQLAPGRSDEKGKPERFAATVREKLIEGTKSRRIMGAGTASEKLPPGINPNHAYAIFGYDADKDLVHMWNPHGNTFHPKGTAGLTTGYTTRRGRFDVPLMDFVKIFRALSIESDRSASGTESPRPAPKRDGAKQPTPK